MATPAAAPDPRQVMAQLDLVQRELSRAERRLATLEQAMVEAQQALGTVRHLAESSGSQQVLLNVLVPLGGGLHVRATVDAAEEVLLPIGAGYSTPGKPAEVAKALEERVSSIGRAYDEAAQRADELANAAGALNEQLPS